MFKDEETLVCFKKIKEYIDSEIEKCAKEIGITKPEADVLIAITLNKDINQGRDVAKLKGFSKSYVSKAVAKLLDRGFISLVLDESDHRCQHIIINAETNDIIAKLREKHKYVTDKLSKGITDEERDVVTSVIKKIKNNIEERK